MIFLFFLLGFLLALVAMEWSGESGLLRSHFFQGHFCFAKCSPKKSLSGNSKKHSTHFSWRVATILCVAIFGGLVACGLYVWEIEWGMFAPYYIGDKRHDDTPMMRYVLHLILFCALAAATMIDLRHLIIPDRITIPATLFAIVFLTAFPTAALPIWEFLLPKPLEISQPAERNASQARATLYGGKSTQYGYFAPPGSEYSTFIHIGWLHFAAAQERFTSIHFPTDEFGNGFILCPPSIPQRVSWYFASVSLAIVWLAIFALLDRVWYARLKFRYAAAIFARYLIRSPRTIPLIVLGIVASAIVGGAMSFAPHENRMALFSSLVGMAVGAGMIWGVRIVGTWALRREAMGFGDVTLMGMIGAFLGWQPCVAIFFLAPFVGIAFLLLQGMRRVDVEIPYGPSLCAATVIVVIFWRTVWQQLEPLVSLGIMLPLVLVVCLILLGLILTAWRSVRNR